MIVDPVVVIPDMLSKKESTNDKLRLDSKNGILPKKAMLNHDKAVSRNACCSDNFLSWSRLDKKNKVPNIIVTIDAPKKDESISE